MKNRLIWECANKKLLIKDVLAVIKQYQLKIINFVINIPRNQELQKK